MKIDSLWIMAQREGNFYIVTQIVWLLTLKHKQDNFKIVAQIGHPTLVVIFIDSASFTFCWKLVSSLPRLDLVWMT